MLWHKPCHNCNYQNISIISKTAFAPRVYFLDTCVNKCDLGQVRGRSDGAVMRGL